MKTRPLILVFALLVGCKAANQRSDLEIASVVPPTASAITGGADVGASGVVACAFAAGQAEFTPFLPFNPAENLGSIGVVVNNTLIDTSGLATVTSTLHTNTAIFLPEKALISY